jgi:hypothetical protein
MSLIASHEVFRPRLGIIVTPLELKSFFQVFRSRIGYLINSASTSPGLGERRRNFSGRG